MSEQQTSLEKGPSTEEIKAAADVLSRLRPGFLPKEIFLEVARLTTTPIAELVPLRRTDSGVEVLLLAREDDDPNWPAMLHTPGTVIRSTDVAHGISEPLTRIVTSELGIPQADEVRYSFVGYMLHNVARGAESTVIYATDLTNLKTPHGQWFPADHLPEDVVSTQRGFIELAVNIFRGKEC